LGSLAAALPLLAFSLFAVATPAEAELPYDSYCYYADAKYSVGACIDTDCCFWCGSDNQRCSRDNGDKGYWSECGSC
jgi:hypothetical protein